MNSYYVSEITLDIRNKKEYFDGRTNNWYVLGDKLNFYFFLIPQKLNVIKQIKQLWPKNDKNVWIAQFYSIILHI